MAGDTPSLFDDQSDDRERPKRTITPTKRSQGQEYDEGLAVKAQTPDPQNYKEAMLDDAPGWTKSMYKEVGKLEERKTWSYAVPPKGANIVGSRFVYHRKLDAKGNVKEQKARLVAQGFSQRDGIDYNEDEIFSPVKQMESWRLLTALAAKHDWEIGQIDVRSAYLYGRMKPGEDIYMRPPEGVTLRGRKPEQVLKLEACLYGLKQAGRRWYDTLMEILIKLGFVRSSYDHGVFYKRFQNQLHIIFVHVDDMGLITPSRKTLEDLKKMIMKEVECTDEGDIHWMLGVEITRDHFKHFRYPGAPFIK